MRSHASPKKNSSTPVTPDVPWRVASLEVLENYCLRVQFKDGLEGLVDMGALITGDAAGVFSALRDPVVFSQANVELGVVTWPGGLDLAPDAMYDSIKKSGTWVVKASGQ